MLPKGEGNACGTCFECCRYNFYLSKHEFDYVEAWLTDAWGSVLEFVATPRPGRHPRRFTPPDLEYRCPLYADGIGCTVYEARPLACRLMGPYLPHHSKLPAWCVFENPTVYSTVDEMPGWNDYVSVLRRHPSPPGYFRLKPGAVPGQVPVQS